jgi:hypothetical protein
MYADTYFKKKYSHLSSRKHQRRPFWVITLNRKIYRKRRPESVDALLVS